MNFQVNISEYDIFNYVFSPELLFEGKKSYIRNNEDKFEQIELYVKQKESFILGLKISTKIKIANKIPAYKIYLQKF